jgi:hypothetical protein
MKTNDLFVQRRHAPQKLWMLALGVLLVGCSRMFLG